MVGINQLSALMDLVVPIFIRQSISVMLTIERHLVYNTAF